jgi:nucleotide-binding universal stress UspA family protein
MQTRTALDQTQNGFQTILVAVGPNDRDRIDRLAEEAIDMAGPSGARVVISHVFTREEYAQYRDSLDYTPDSEVTPHVVARRFDPIRELGSALEAAGVEYDVRGALGEEGDEITELVEDEDADMVVVSGRKRSAVGKAVFGSTAQKVMLSAPCPVTYVRADSR